MEGPAPERDPRPELLYEVDDERYAAPGLIPIVLTSYLSSVEASESEAAPRKQRIATLLGRQRELAVVCPSTWDRLEHDFDIPEQVCLMTYESIGKPRIVAGDQTATIRAWDGDDFSLLFTHNELENQYPSMLTSYLRPSNGDARVVVGWASGRVSILNGESGACLIAMEVFSKDVGIRVIATFTGPSQQQRLVVGGKTGQVKVYEAENGTLLHELAGHKTDITKLVCYEPSFVAAAGSSVREACLWNAEEGTLVNTLIARVSKITDLIAYHASTPDGDRARLAAGTEGGSILIFDGESGAMLRAVTGQMGWIRRLISYSAARGPRLASLCNNGVLGLLDPEAGQLLVPLYPTERGCYGAAIHVIQTEGATDGGGAGGGEAGEGETIVSRNILVFASPGGDRIRAWDLGPARKVESAPLLRSALKR
jgi:hypothetical protein